jgi:hypothetical protein
MSSQEPRRASDVRVPGKLNGWRLAIVISAATAIAPVIFLVLFVLLGTVLPVLLFSPALFVRFWLHRQRRPLPPTRARPPLVLHPPMGDAAAPWP